MAFWRFRIRGNQVLGMSDSMPGISFPGFQDGVEVNNHPDRDTLNANTHNLAGGQNLIYDPAVPEIRFMDGGAISGPEHTQAIADEATDARLIRRERTKFEVRTRANRAMLRQIVRYINQTFRLKAGQSTKTLQQIFQDLDASTDAGDND